MIEQQVVEKVARLAQLKLSEEELKHYQIELGKIVDYVQQLELADDSSLASWREDLDRPSTPERVDEAIRSEVIAEVLQGAPRVLGTAFQVPRIIE